MVNRTGASFFGGTSSIPGLHKEMGQGDSLVRRAGWRRSGGLLSRRDFLLSAGTCTATVTLLGCTALGTESRRVRAQPNVVILFADDLGYGDVSCYGARNAATPHIDSIARNGVKFTDAYVAAPLCSPSRAGLLTGRYPQRFGLEFNAGPAKRCHEEGLGLPAAEVVLAQLLKSAGYATGITGKWHLGSQSGFLPTHGGFDEFFGFLHGANLYVESLGREVLYTFPPHDRSSAKGMFKPRKGTEAIFRGIEPVKEREYLTDAFTREALKFIDRHAGKPFFLYVPFSAVHTPLQVTEKYYKRCDKILDERKRIYAAMISALDDGVGAVLKKLKEKGIERETLVFFLSDNGAPLIGSNGPLLGGKMSLFEGGIRIPFCVQWPGRIPASQIFSRPVSSLDIFPTVAGLAGAEIPATLRVDGLDLMPFLAGKKETGPHEILFWRVGTNLAVRKGYWKYVNLNRKHELLFDLSKDAGEKHDLSKDCPKILAELKKALAEWESQLAEPKWTGRRIEVDLQQYGLTGRGEVFY